MFCEVKKEETFPQIEECVLGLWGKDESFKKSLDSRPACLPDGLESNSYTFYNGPPFATGLPHYGHLLAGTIKDIVPHYWTMKGKLFPAVLVGTATASPLNLSCRTNSVSLALPKSRSSASISSTKLAEARCSSTRANGRRLFAAWAAGSSCSKAAIPFGSEMSEHKCSAASLASVAFDKGYKARQYLSLTLIAQYGRSQVQGHEHSRVDDDPVDALFQLLHCCGSGYGLQPGGTGWQEVLDCRKPDRGLLQEYEHR